MHTAAAATSRLSPVCPGPVRGRGDARPAAEHGAGVQRGGRHVRHRGPGLLHPVPPGPTRGTEATDGVPAPEQALW